ncbi:GNAT family N-acetyltransferase [Candidatus Clostridium stratigraminis]|uniref:GNAT family N-acetyltransferase n=1 Tax=Candidatus Clostridium stratigraminis TaxID=3381661 RepID=A0ABW8T1J1_9CLOT
MIKLEPLHKEDFKKIVQWNEGHSAEFLLQWAGPFYEYPLTEEQIERYFENYVLKEKDTLYVYKIISLETNEMIGTIELYQKDPINKIGRIGRFLIGDENHRGKGAGKEALKEAIRIGFEKLKLNKITLGVFDFNISAIKCYESVGFAIEELKENFRKIGDSYWNLYDMGITKEKWEEIYK